MDLELKQDMDAKAAEGAKGMRSTVTIKGKEYVLQHPGIRWYIQLTDRCRNATGVIMQEKYIDALLENVVILPRTRLEDFGPDMEVMNELITRIETFLGSPVQRS